jgi:hypothetical protein
MARWMHKKKKEAINFLAKTLFSVLHSKQSVVSTVFLYKNNTPYIPNSTNKSKFIMLPESSFFDSTQKCFQ